MARLNIDTGTEGNSATGDTLRTAFGKVNDNFIEVYDDLAASSLGGLFTNNETNGDVKIQPNGTGIVEVDQLQINNDAITSLITNGDLTLSGNGTGGVVALGDLTAGQLVTNNITSRGSNANINIEPQGTGDILLKAGGQVGIGDVGSPDTSLHIKQANAIITLQRTSDANTPGIDFQSAGGNTRAQIYMDGTNGVNKEIIFKVRDDSSTDERFRVTKSGANVTGTFLLKDDSDSTLGDATISMAENKITALRSNDNLEISASGTGEIIMSSSVLLKGETPFVKIQRTDNANVPGIDFIGQAGTSGAKILFDGTDGTANELIFQTFSVAGGLAESFRAQQGGAKVTGTLDVDGAITITDNSISASRSNDNLELAGGGTGSVLIGTSLKFSTGPTIAGFVDEDDMASNSAIALATQQSIKAYVDNAIGGFTFSGNTMTTSSNADIELTPGGTGNINVPAGVGLTFGSQTERIENTSGSNLYLYADTNIYLNAENDLHFDANGGDIVLKDNGTKFGQFSQLGSKLTIYSGPSSNAEITLGGAVLCENVSVKFTNLPTSDPGVAGRLWRSGTDLKISVG